MHPQHDRVKGERFYTDGHTRFEFCLCVELSVIGQAPSLLSLSSLGFFWFGLVVVSDMESH